MISFLRPLRPDPQRIAGAKDSALVSIAALLGTLILLCPCSSAGPLAPMAEPLTYGSTIEGQIAVAGGVDTCTFDGNVGDAIIVRVRGDWQDSVLLELYDSLGVLVAADTGAFNARIDTVLADGGKYTVLIKDLQGDSSGAYGVSLQRRFSPGSAVALAYGQTVLDTTTKRAEMHAYTIAATAGDWIVARVSSAWSSSGQIELYDPTGGLVASHYGTAAARIDAVLTSTGTYTLLVMDREGNDVGVYGVHLQRRFQPGSAIATTYGETKIGGIAKRAEADAYTFAGDDGDRIVIRTTGSWSASPQLELYDSLGGLVATNYGSWGARIDTVLAGSGQYTLLVMDREGNDIGSYGVHVQRRFGPGNAVTLGYGETVPGAFTQVAEIHAYTFAATAGDRILARMRFTTVQFHGQLELYNPTGGRVAVDSAEWGARIDTLLPSTGTYTLLVMDKEGDEIGSYGVHVQRRFTPGDFVALTYGETKTDTFTMTAEIHAYTFTAGANDRILTRMSGIWQDSARVELYNSTGTLVASNTGYGKARIDTLLVNAGAYTLLVMDKEGDDVGAGAIYGLHLQRRHTPGSPVALAYGQTVMDTTTQRAEIHAYTIAATAGDRIVARMNSVWQASAQIELYNPVGGLLVSQYGTGAARIDTVLATAGSYTLLVMDREGDTTGVYGVHLQRRHTPGSAVALAHGQTVLDTTTKRAEIHAYTIAAAAGDRIVARMSSVWTSSGRLELYDPTGGLLASHSGTGAARIDTVLTGAGTYTLLVMDQEGDDTGIYGVSLQRRFTPGSAVALTYGQTVLGTMTTRAEIHAYTITTVTATNRILVRMSGAWGSSSQVELYNATGGLVASSYAGGGTRIDTVLSAAATYTLLVMDREGDNTGSYGVHLQLRFGSPGAVALEYGQTVSGTITKLAETKAYTFVAEAGDRIVARTAGSWNPAPQLEIYDSLGTPVAVNYGSWGARIDTVLLKNGAYTLLIMDKEGDNTGTYGLHVQRRFAPGNAVPLLYGDAKQDTLTQWAEIRAFTFIGDSGDAIIARLRSEWQFSGQMELYDSAGGLVTTREGDWGFRIDTLLPRDGEYTLLIMDREGDDVGAFGVHVQRRFKPGRAVAMDYGSSESDTISQWAETRAYTFIAEAGDRILARMRGAWQFSGRLELYDSSGVFVAANQQSWGARIDTLLAKGGKYTLLVLDPEGENVGAFGVHVQRRFAPGHADTLSFTEGGNEAQDTITHWAQSKAYVFEGHAHDGIQIQMTSAWTSHAQFELYDSTGTLVITKWGYGSTQSEVVLPKGGQYTILLLDRDGNDVGTCSVRLEFDFTDVRDLPGGALPTDFALSQNYPNPFNPGTTIQYALRRDCHTEVTVFDVLGRRVRTLVDADQPAGRYAIPWDGRDDHDHAVASGIYLYRIEAADFVMTRKMVLLK